MLNRKTKQHSLNSKRPSCGKETDFCLFLGVGRVQRVLGRTLKSCRRQSFTEQNEELRKSSKLVTQHWLRAGPEPGAPDSAGLVSLPPKAHSAESRSTRRSVQPGVKGCEEDPGDSDNDWPHIRRRAPSPRKTEAHGYSQEASRPPCAAHPASQLRHLSSSI